MPDVVSLRNLFRSIYRAEPRIFSAPGRVNLIGEHTDYNEGFVLPMAIERRTMVAAAPRADRKITVRSTSHEERGDLHLDRLGRSRHRSWIDYIAGMAEVLRTRAVKLTGADLLIDGDVPAGAGLSSSAALEMAVGLALSSLAGEPKLPPVELALAAQAAEHAYVGTQCGIMDQLTAALARADHALLIDCRSRSATRSYSFAIPR
jgi:galactokinase